MATSSRRSTFLTLPVVCTGLLTFFSHSHFDILVLILLLPLKFRSSLIQWAPMSIEEAENQLWMLTVLSTARRTDSFWQILRASNSRNSEFAC
ncbi:hypothetical protein BC938DRAFT_479981 [Jimgerdemannia flammicorona]|uniref:Uncharacterized protein n=1 Tax=Jimgerdemannia flammicorona TaxID=994334 RepID=A0A433QJN1_9FUNG|nr:hypothetical protein BC938DRAFT_479981 [Jimgerdemannia flammicorona]